MANEISFTVSISLRNGSLVDSFTNSTTSATQTNQLISKNVESIGFADSQALNILSTVILPSGPGAGFAVFRNLDATNFVQIGVKPASTFYPFIRLLAGESCLLRLDGTLTAIYAKADTAAVKLFYSVYAV
jgi:hypothetical protein